MGFKARLFHVNGKANNIFTKCSKHRRSTYVLELNVPL